MAALIRAEPLTAAAFAPFGDVIEARGAADLMINAGRCARHHDLAALDFGPEGRAGISVFVSEPVRLPHRVDLVERHPLGSQSFLPLSEAPFLVVVAPDVGDRPGPPRGFVTAPGQGVSYRRGTWHGVLTPLDAPQRFAVVDRIGPGENCEIHRYAPPIVIHPPMPG